MATIEDGDASRSVLESLRPPDTELAFQDDLTGLYNYRLLTRLLEEKWSDLTSLAGSFALVLMDLNLFKQVNDRYGHLSGDEVLKETAAILRASFRKGDFIFRYGGDEFVVLLPLAETAEARMLGERARSAMLAHDFLANEDRKRIEVPVSFSIGVSAFPADGAEGLALLAIADERLYREKKEFVARLMRPRRIASGLTVAAALVALAVGGYYLRGSWDSAPEPAPPAVVAAAPAAGSAAPVEAEMLAQIEQLKAQIDLLTRERAKKGSVASESNADEIARLQQQITDLSARLASQPASRSADDADAAPAQAPVRRPAPVAPAATTTPATASHSDPDLPPQSRPAGTLVPPRLLQPVIPRYPDFAMEKGMEATVGIRVLIDEDGHVVRAVFTGEPKGFGFDEAAKSAALLSRWRPGTRDGVPVPSEAILQVIFKQR